MSVNTTLAGLSQTASNNGPDGTVDPPSTIDDAQRYLGSFIATLRDGKGFTGAATLASASTTDIGAQNSLAVEISGTTTITSFGANYNGPRFLRFTGALILTHNATTLNLPGGANITTANGAQAIAVPNQAANGWNVLFAPATGNAAAGANNDITALNALPVSGPGLIPVGAIEAFSGTTAPAGWLICPTAQTNISRTTYANLHAYVAAAGYPWGVGDGSTTFGMPWFPADHVLVQANANVGTFTTGQVISHTHGEGTTNVAGAGASSISGAGNLRNNTLQTDATGGAANLPAGGRVLICVKY